jgi:hypothetical protein
LPKGERTAGGARRGKPFIQVPSYAPEILKGLADPFDCLLICGPQGNYPIDAPAAAVMTSQGKWQTLHMADPELAALTFKTRTGDLPESGRDWFYPFGFDRRRTAQVFGVVRKRSAKANHRLRQEQAERRAARAAARSRPAAVAAE